MADADKLKDDFLTCPLCLELYKEPKVLDCQHTFCLLCLQRYMASQQTITSQCICPLCKAATAIPENDVRQLKNNFLMVGLLQFATCQRQGDGNDLPGELPGAVCPACEETKICAAHCGVCEMWLCTSCTRSHSKLPATRGHTVISLADIHTQGSVKLKQLDEMFSKLNEETDVRYDEILHHCRLVGDQMQMASAQINNTADQMRAAIEDKRENLLIQLTTMMSNVEDQLRRLTAAAENRKREIEQAQTRVKEAHGSSDALLVMRTVHELQQNMRYITPLADIPNSLKSACGVQFHQAHSLLSNLQSDTLGSICTLPQLAAVEALHFPGDRVPPSIDLQVHVNAGFVSSIATYGAQGNVLFATGCEEVHRLVTPVGRGSRAQSFDENYKSWKKPWGIAVTADNKVLVTDAGAHVGEGFVAKYGVDGKFQAYIASGLSMPRGIAVSCVGQVFVCDQEDRCVYVFDGQKNFNLVKVLKKDSSGNYLFVAPLHVTVARNLDIIVSDAGHTIKTFTRNFNVKASYHSPFPDSEFWGVCTDHQGHVYVADWKHGVHALSNTSALAFEGFVRDVSGARVLEPSAVSFHSQTGKLFMGSSSGQIYAAKLY